MLALGWYFYGQPSFRKGDVTTPSVADRNSIAVLPFINISGKPDEDYFSDGMTEELLNVLAKIPKLNVVARTSVFEFKGKGGDVREIGRKLGVSNIVEGSVRRDREQVRVTAQLVRVADGFHIWSETYDRKLESVFALQDEIAQRIGAALKLSLGFSPPVAARAPIDPEAYDEYLKGRALLRQRSDLPSARQLLRRAEAAQCLQSRRRVRGRCLALASGGVNFLPGFRLAGMGDEDFYHNHHLRLSRGADFFLGV